MPLGTEEAVTKCTGTIYPHWYDKKYLYIAAKKNSNQTGKKIYGDQEHR